MSFRYKSALLSLASLLILYGYYFARVISEFASRAHVVDQVVLLVGIVVAIVVVQVVGHAILALTSADRYGPMDERERAIDRKATGVGYYLLIVTSLGAGLTLHFGAGKADMANAILAAVVLAECVRQAVFLALHHRAA